jgi:hypothetical protein
MTTQAMSVLPREVIAIDWGATPKKRQLCRAVLRAGRYVVLPPVSIPSATEVPLAPGTLVGFDVMLGLPPAYAARMELPSFREALKRFGQGEYADFYRPAALPEEITEHRPFYPAAAGGAKREHLVAVLGPAAFDLRPCDRATGAGPLFWLIGAKQVGRSSITVWRDLLTPHLERIALWPFDGTLDALLQGERCVVAETYPAHLGRALGLSLASKRDAAQRAAAGAQLLATKRPMIDLFEVRELLLSGFGASADGEDAFDATIACIGLAQMLTSGRLPEPPEEARAVEGWILGL